MNELFVISNLRNIPKVLIFCFFAFFISNSNAQSNKTYSTKKQHKEFYDQFIEKYNSSDVKRVWESDVNEKFEDYINGNTEKELISTYSTVIHELLHGFNNIDFDGHHYFIEKDIRIYVPFTKIFNSKELNSFVRKGQQDSIVRYNIYIAAKNEVYGYGKVGNIDFSGINEPMSVEKGIYGLIEEFSAYFYGSLSVYELFDYYKSKYKIDDSEAWNDYKDPVYSESMAYYEFNLFIGWYLIYAKEKHPDIYKELINNKPLRVVYSLMDDKFRNLVTNFDARVQEINKNLKPEVIDILDFSGSDDDIIRFLELAGMESETIYKLETKLINGHKVETKKIILDERIYKDLKKQYFDVAKQFQKTLDSSKFTFLKFEQNIEYLKKQYTPEIYDELKKFRIEGVISVNYKNFIK